VFIFVQAAMRLVLAQPQPGRFLAERRQRRILGTQPFRQLERGVFNRLDFRVRFGAILAGVGPVRPGLFLRGLFLPRSHRRAGQHRSLDRRPGAGRARGISRRGNAGRTPAGSRGGRAAGRRIRGRRG
jgi:hypothetical protein